jgi:hypothetical protein
MSSAGRRVVIVLTPSRTLFCDAFVRRLRLTGLLDGVVRRCPLLRHEQTTRIRAEHHGLMIASVVRRYIIIPTPSLDAFPQRYCSTLLLDGSARRYR